MVHKRSFSGVKDVPADTFYRFHVSSPVRFYAQFMKKLDSGGGFSGQFCAFCYQKDALFDAFLEVFCQNFALFGQFWAIFGQNHVLFDAFGVCGLLQYDFAGLFTAVFRTSHDGLGDHFLPL